MVATEAVVRALRAAHLHDAGRQALLQMACDRIRSWGSPYTAVYAYMLRDGELVLEAHAGRETEHVRIPVGAGVCGTAVAEKATRTFRTSPRLAITLPVTHSRNRNSW